MKFFDFLVPYEAGCILAERIAARSPAEIPFFLKRARRGRQRWTTRLLFGRKRRFLDGLIRRLEQEELRGALGPNRRPDGEPGSLKAHAGRDGEMAPTRRGRGCPAAAADPGPESVTSAGSGPGPRHAERARSGGVGAP